MFDREMNLFYACFWSVEAATGTVLKGIAEADLLASNGGRKT